MNRPVSHLHNPCAHPVGAGLAPALLFTNRHPAPRVGVDLCVYPYFYINVIAISGDAVCRVGSAHRFCAALLAGTACPTFSLSIPYQRIDS